jgi:LacI family transcriptional regulator
MKDVASLAGVSIGTVSNVLNAPERVSQATRQRVLVAIDKLGWVRNETARQLRAGRSTVIGLVVLDIGNPFFADVTRGAEEFLYGQGASVHVGNSDQRTDREAMLLRHFEQQRVRGLLLAPIGELGDQVLRVRQHGIPIVLIDRAEGAGFCSVGVDDFQGGHLAVTHLISQGHRRIAFVGGPSTLPQVRDRRRGAELAVANGPAGSTLITLDTATLDLDCGTAAARQLADYPRAERPTGVFAANDLLAIGLLQGLVQAGCRVPEDIALMGFDDIEFAAAATVPLSSVRQPRRALGARAAELLFEEISAADEHRPHHHETVRFTPMLIARRSTEGGPADA